MRNQAPAENRRMGIYFCRTRSLIFLITAGLFIGWHLKQITSRHFSVNTQSFAGNASEIDISSSSIEFRPKNLGTRLYKSFRDVPLPYADLIEKSPAPLPSGCPPQPSVPVGIMPLKDCLEYIHSQGWTGVTKPRSKEIACTPRQSLTLLRVSTGCRSIGAPPFSVFVCWNASSGELAVRIARTGACPLDAPFSDNDETIKTVKRRFGPDSFRVRIEGPEIFVVDFTHNGGCRYSGRVCVSVSGWYTLQAVHLFGEFHAFTELLPKTEYVLAPLTDRRYRLGLALISNATCVRPFETTQCSIEGLAHGRWVRPEPVRRYLDPFPPWKLPRVPARNLAEVHSWGLDAIWTPYNCSWRTVSQSQTHACMANASVLFVGDSQTRSFFYSFLNHLREEKIVGNPKIANFDGLSKSALVWKVAPNIRMQFSPDPFLTLPHTFRALLRSTKYNVVVLGMGNWPGASNIEPSGFWPFSYYRAHIDSLARDLKAFKVRTGTLVLWHTIPAFPIGDYDEWRNNGRFQLYNEYCIERFRDADIPVLDIFSVSLAMIHMAHDGSHFAQLVDDVWAEMLAIYLCGGNTTLRKNV